MLSKAGGLPPRIKDGGGGGKYETDGEGRAGGEGGEKVDGEGKAGAEGGEKVEGEGEREEEEVM